MSTAIARWLRATEDFNPADHPRAPGKAPGGIGGQFVSGLIHGLVGHGGREEHSPAVARMATGRGTHISTAGPVKKVAAPRAPKAPRTTKPKSLMSQMTVEQRRTARSYGLPDNHPLLALADRISGARSEQEMSNLLRDVHDDDVTQIGRELGVKFPAGMSAEDRKQHIARSIAAFGMVGSLSTPLPAKKATAAQRMSRAAKRPPADIAASLRSATTREEADAHLHGLTVAELKAVGSETGTTFVGATTKDAMRERIIEHAIGSRLNSEVLRGGSWDNAGAPEPPRAVAKMTRGKAAASVAAGLAAFEGPSEPAATTGAGRMQDIADRLEALHSAEEIRAALTDVKDARTLRGVARRWNVQVPADMKRPWEIRGLIADTIARDKHERRGLIGYDPAAGSSGLRPKADAGVSPAPRGAVAKMARAKAPAAVAVSRPDGPPVKTAWTFDMGPGVAAQYGRTGGDEPLYLPNGGADQGLVHLDSQLGGLWRDLTADNREPNSFVNAVARIGEDVGTGTISLDQAANRLRGLSANATDQAVVRRIEATIRGITESIPPPSIDVPSSVPPSIRLWLEGLAEIPTMRKTNLPGQRRDRSVLDEALDLVRRISAEPRQFRAGEAESQLRDITRNVHESADGVYQARRLTDQAFAGSEMAEIRDWLRGRPKA